MAVGRMSELDNLKRVVDLLTGVDIAERIKRHPFASGRRVYCEVARRFFPKRSYAQIGYRIDRNHATVLYHTSDRAPIRTPYENQLYDQTVDIIKNNIEVEIDQDADLKNTVNILKEKLIESNIALMEAENKIFKLRKQGKAELLRPDEIKLLLLYDLMNTKGRKDLYQKATIIQKMNAV